MVTFSAKKDKNFVQFLSIELILIDHNQMCVVTAMIEERANLPNISLQPVVVGAAKKTSNAVGHAKKTIMNLISRVNEYGSDSDEEGSDKVEY